MNENRDLLGFDNGVYDLKNLNFRNALREEYVINTAGYYYEKSNEKDINKIKEIIKGMFTDNKLYKYFMNVLSLSLINNKTDNKFIWNG